MNCKGSTVTGTRVLMLGHISFSRHFLATDVNTTDLESLRMDMLGFYSTRITMEALNICMGLLLVLVTY